MSPYLGHRYEYLRKGAWVLYGLRRALGEETYGKRSAPMRTVPRQNVRTCDFQAVVEEASGQNRDEFFKTWLQEPGVRAMDAAWMIQPAAANYQLLLEACMSRQPTVLRRLPMESCHWIWCCRAQWRDDPAKHPARRTNSR